MDRQWSNQLRRLGLAGAVCFAMSLAAGPALAASPISVEAVDNVFSGQDRGLAVACGLTAVDVHGHVRGSIRRYADGTVRDHIVQSLTYTTPGGSGWVSESFARSGRFGPPDSVSVDGDLRTEVYHDTLVGLTSLWQGARTGVIAREAGWITTEIVLVFDTSVEPWGLRSVELSTLDSAGPHPIAEAGARLPDEVLDTVCEELAA